MYVCMDLCMYVYMYIHVCMYVCIDVCMYVLYVDMGWIIDNSKDYMFQGNSNSRSNG